MFRGPLGEMPLVRSWHSLISSALVGRTSSAEKSASNNAMSNGGREPGWTLRRRLQAIITLALLPVVLVSIFQGVARARLDIDNVHTTLLQQARTVAAGGHHLPAAPQQGLAPGGIPSGGRGRDGHVG